MRTQCLSICAAIVLSLSGIAAESARADSPKILAIGDSLMASHSISGRAIADHVERLSGHKVTDRSVLGARMIYNLPLTGAMGLSIPAQLDRSTWDYVIMTGGGNDLWLGCGCLACDRKLDRLISKDGLKGEIPSLMAKIVNKGGQVIYVGYLRSPGIDTPIEHCKDEGDILEQRIAILASRIKGVHFLSNQDLIPSGDLSYLAVDRIHPSLKASQAIAVRIVELLGKIQPAQ